MAIKTLHLPIFIGMTARFFSINNMTPLTHYRPCLIWMAAFSLCACSMTVQTIKDININGLIIIQQAYQQAVMTAHTDSQYAWNNGRLGNIIVNVNGEPNRGLCHHWQQLVYKGIQPALLETGWKATGIAINEGSFFEHHAVLVYDPGKISMEDILKDTKKSDSYVLDPWSSGEARVYTVGNWVKLPVTIKVKPRLTKVDIMSANSSLP
jgi:hypothetical protein